MIKNSIDHSVPLLDLFSVPLRGGNLDLILGNQFGNQKSVNKRIDGIGGTAQ